MVINVTCEWPQCHRKNAISMKMTVLGILKKNKYFQKFHKNNFKIQISFTYNWNERFFKYSLFIEEEWLEPLFEINLNIHMYVKSKHSCGLCSGILYGTLGDKSVRQPLKPLKEDILKSYWHNLFYRRNAFSIAIVQYSGVV